MWGLSLVMAACLLAIGEGYYFESGYSHHYTYHAENALLGQENITTVLKFHVSPVNETEEGHKLHLLTVDSLVQYVKNGMIMNNPFHWDLSRAFLFAVEDGGGVTLVHCHPEDHEELLIIKKAMVSVFSVHVKTEETKDSWDYTAEQSDHLGRQKHHYKANRTETGLKLHRNFSSFDDAHRFHEKTLEYDHHGTLHAAETKDRVHLKDRSPPSEKTTGLPGELPHKVTMSGEFPEIEASATVRVKLEGKRPIVTSPQAVFHNLTVQTLETKLKHEQYKLEMVRENITRTFDCFRKYPDKDDVNRSLCVNELRAILQKLDREEYKELVASIFAARCQTNETACEDRHLILIDVISRIGDVTSQELLMTHVLLKKPPVDEELRRVFIHCVALERPVQKFVRAVESFCFGPDGEHHSTRKMNRTQSRACLAVGSLTRHLSNGGRQTLANRLADRLETWLDQHGKVDHHLSKRSTWLEDTEDEAHHISKAVLLHALGNAALTRSRRHLVEHAQPNKGHHVWRRAALDALRKYDCKESATVMLESLLNDQIYTVREMALSVYAKHPRRGEVTRDKENDVLSRNYTYPAVARVKRDVFETVLLKFNVEIPSLDWKKEIGTKAVGASFGIYFNNYIHVLFKVLSGYVDVNAHDKLWAEIHLGIINRQWDILRVEACYRGRLSYNMNIVKDFSVGMAEDISSAFDHIANRIIEPMEKAANELASKYQDPNTNKPKSGFDPMAQAVKQLPKRTQNALQSTIDLSKATETLGGLPIITKIKQLSARAQSLMEDVHSEATDLFSSIKDAAVVALPFAEKEIRKSINTVLDKLGDVSKAPRQVFSFIERGKMGYQLAMQRIMEGNNVIKQATSFLSGTRSTFMNAGQELKEIMDTTRQLVARLKAEHSRRKREANPFDEMGQNIESGLDSALSGLYAAADSMITKVNDTSGIAQELQHGFDQQALYTEILKTSFEAMKEAIDMIKSRINALFGQKFHPKFPDQRRDCDSKCGCGYFTGECRHGTPGLDLKWEPEWGIPSPVAGVMTRTGNYSVIIKPSTAGFTDYEIILANILISVNIEDGGTFVDAGQSIGTPRGKNDCEDSHFHLAMKRTAPDTANGVCYYVDPSPFIDRMQPVPKWTEECKHFTFKHIGDVIDFDKLTEGFKEVLQELKRFALDVGKNLLMKAVAAIPDTGFLGTLKGIAGNIVRNLDLDPANLKNLFKDGMNAAKGFFNNISTGKFSLGGIMGMAQNALGGLGNNPLSQSLSTVTGLIGQARNFLKNPSFGKLLSFGTGAITRLMTSRSSASGGHGCGSGSSSGFDVGSMLQSGLGGLGSVFGQGGSGILGGLTSQIQSFAGGRASMTSNLKASACNMCPSFAAALAASQSACIADEDCLGINCDVSISGIPMVSGKIDFSLRVHPGERKVTITSNNGRQANEISGNGAQTIGGIKVAGTIDVKLDLRAVWQGQELRFSVSIKACAMGFCAPEINVLKDIRFDKRGRRKRSAEDILGPFLSNLESLPIDGVASMFTDFNFPMDDIVGQVTGIQEQISSALKVNQDQSEPTMKTEFKNPFDHKDGGLFPLPWQNGEVYIPFFFFKFIYPMGPCFFVFDFDAGGAFGVSFQVKVQAIDSKLFAEFKPWISGKLHASMTLNLLVAKAGIRLTGYILKTGFPLSITTNYNKQPVETRKALEVELIPLELILHGYLTILWIIKLEKDIWRWAADPIRGTIWEKKYKKEDRGPPRFQYCDKVAEQCGGRRRRQIRDAGPACTVKQMAGRHPHDPAFKIEFAAEDEDSDLKLWYAVGDYPGGTNIVGWTEMRGAALLVPAALPCGIPIHFVVRARNTQGLETTGQCSIPTYDCTIPDGRVDAAYRCTSHPSSLSASVILYEDSSLVPERLYHGVGYSPSSYGHEVVDWLPLTLTKPTLQFGVSGDLRHFSSPRPGRLTSTPKRTSQTPTAAQCASQCLQLTTCVAFTHNQYLHDCELQEVTEGASAERKADGHFVTYERLGNALSAALRYENLSLRHGTRYYINADVVNVLGYRATLTSEGTMVDMTPPEPGYTGNVIKDELTAAGCGVSILQRCVDHVTGSLNHRTIIDGPGSTTVFNGNRKGQELQHTIENYHASANWGGFMDEECGLHGYTFAVGSTICGDDVAGFTDPHKHIQNRDDWTHTGLAKNLHLPDGRYYVTVQAVSDVIHGGDLVTSVCHSTPFVIDTTPPDMNSVEEVLFDETFRYLVVYYNASDVISGVARMEFGLGRTKYDVMIRRYLPFEIRGEEDNTYLVNEEFETEDGVPAWIRLKVVNNVGLSATGSSDAPIILDSTEPLPGDVMDGSELGRDLCCQNGTSQICAQWEGFQDPDSNIESYNWGVGLTPGTDDVVPFHRLTSYDKESCVDVQLTHNVTYFSTVIAYNKALNQKTTNTTSDGLLVDITPPILGNVSDGTDVNNDDDFTSEKATVSTSWRDFLDPESGLRPYSLSVLVNSEVDKVFTDITGETYTDHSLSLQHGDVVHAELLATNRAGSSVTVSSDGMLVDHTPPALDHLHTVNSTRYQQRDDTLHFTWRFDDHESGVAEYRCVVYQVYQGRRTKFWPGTADTHNVQLNGTSSAGSELELEGLRLQNGAAYSLIVTAINRAKLATKEESAAVVVDTTPPDVLMVRLSRPEEEEEVNDADQVEHVDGEPLWVTWDPHDAESGVADNWVCIGMAGSGDCLPTLTQTLGGSLVYTTSFGVDGLNVSSDEGQFLYQVYIVVVNGAGVQSAVAVSRAFLVLKANVAGAVLDGRGSDDADFSHDAAAIAITFSGFSSEACGIVGYEWGVGTSPYATDVLPYSHFGLVVDEQGAGWAQAHVTQWEGQTYYSTVRARTGYDCHEEYIVSSSDGVTLDTTRPSVTFHADTRTVTSDHVVYQAEGNTLGVTWRGEDASGVNETQIVLRVYENTGQVLTVPSQSTDPVALDTPALSGDTVFSTMIMTDKAGNTLISPLPPVTFDYTPPKLRNLECTQVVSSMASVLTCSWLSVEEAHSALSDIKLGLGSGPSAANLLNLTSLPLHSRQWTVDTQDLITSPNVTEFYVIVVVTNAAGFKTETKVKVLCDVTPPTTFSVRVVTSAQSGYHDVEQQCQTSQDYMEVLIQGLEDAESNIESVELALGSSPGRSDVKPFHQYPVVHGLYAMGSLALPPGPSVYVTARATNTVGLYTLGASQAVAISPEPRVEVRDGGGEGDMDGQAEMHVMLGTWRYSDSCPVLSVEWAVKELCGQVVTNFTSIPDNRQQFYNDGLALENLRTYVNYVRVQDAMHRTFTAYSDGITVLIRQPDPATVRDGLTTSDLDFQEPTDRLSANWDAFGQAGSTVPSDVIVRYEAAVGTDRRLSKTRADVHGFIDLGLHTSITFHGLNLTAKTATYYVTVRAYSAAGSLTESSSDGIKVGYSADVTPGAVQMPRFQSSVSSIRFSWAAFVSDMVITHYFVGVSTTAPPWDNSTHACSQLLNTDSFHFDVYALQSLQAESMAVIDGLSLWHGGRYYVTLVAQDNMGQCSAAVSREMLVDTTPPVAGHVAADGTDAGTVMFLHSEHTVYVNLDDFPDKESGVSGVEVELVQSEDCHAQALPNSFTTLSKISALNQSRVAMRNVHLQENILYFLKVRVTNGAGLETTATSRPLMLDMSPPLSGLVKLGSNWTAADRTFQKETDSVTGMIALRALATQQACATEVDLLSQDSRDQWQAKGGEFCEDCVGFDESGLHVIIRHNPYLTGVDKGAAQFHSMTWREGDYVFKMTPATGHNVLSGIALTSPSAQAPFLSQNGLELVNRSSVTCDPPVEICLDKNDTSSQRAMLADTDYGLGLSFMQHGGQVQALFWAQDVLQRKETWIALDFDPGVIAAVFVLNLQKQVTDTKKSWEATISIDGVAKAGVSGLVLPEECVLSVYTWNIDAFFPPITDQFQPFTASTVIRAMSLPVEVRPLCSYGRPFHDPLSGIRQVWLGVSDDFNSAANVASYTLVKSFCLPCLKGCHNICSACSGESVSGDYSVLPVSISGLDLQAANEVHPVNVSLETNSTSSDNSSLDASSTSNDNNSLDANTTSSDNSSLDANSTLSDNSSVEARSASQELRAFRLPTYYLDVRVVDHSGLATEVKSVGVVVDTSPPVIVSLHCTDPEYMPDVAVLYLGNNHTVGVKWDVTEDVTSVQDVMLCIGTEPRLEDVARTVHPDLSKTEYVFDDLAPRLMDNSTYFVTLEVRNQAGLSSRAWSNFTVQTTPPDMSAVSLSVPPSVTVVNFGGVDVGLVENMDWLELTLEQDPAMADETDVEHFEWAIGTSAGMDDIFPQTVIGTKQTKTVAIVNGFVQRDDLKHNISIGDYAKQNYTSDTQPDPSANKFEMEPGRCIYQQLYGVSKSHTYTALDATPVCIKRPGDVILEADNITHEMMKVNDTFSMDASASTSDSTLTSDSLRVKLKLSKGAMVVGVLMEKDLDAQYGTSASTEFSPFIVRPDPLADDSSRWLKKRLISMPGPEMFLSPMAKAQLSGDVDVSYAVPNSVDIPDDSLVIIVFWNPDTRKWDTPQEVCPMASQDYNNVTRIVSAKLCAEVFSVRTKTDSTNPATRRKRSTTTTTALGSLGPRMVVVAVVRNSTINQPPVVSSSSFSALEDGGVYNYTIVYTDNEGDRVAFSLFGQPGHGTADVTRDGLVQYRPDPDFSGTDVIHVSGTEEIDPTALSLGVVPHTVRFTITVRVSAVNDPPEIAYLPSAEGNDTITQVKMVGPTAGNGVNMSVYVEGNTTSLATLGTVLFSDVDSGDSVSYEDAEIVDTGADLIVSDTDPSDPRLSGPTAPSGKDIAVNLTAGYSGHAVYHARVRDTVGAYSRQLTLNVYVLISPCFHGNCEPRVMPGKCQHPQRAFTFDQYFCKCDLGYEGQWCETDTNECAKTTCSPITDCVDEIGGYRCDYNPTKLAAIIVCCVVAGLLGLVVVYKLKKRKKVGDWWPNSSHSDSMADLKAAIWRPGTAHSTTDIECTTDVTPEAETAFTPEAETAVAPEVQWEYAFMNDPLFTYRPSQNPLAVKKTSPDTSANAEDVPEDIVQSASSQQGKPPTATKGPTARNTKPSKAKKAEVDPTEKQHSLSANTASAAAATPADKNPDFSGHDDVSSHDDVTSARPVSAGNRHSSVSGVVESDRELPKVEN